MREGQDVKAFGHTELEMLSSGVLVEDVYRRVEGERETERRRETERGEGEMRERGRGREA